MPVPTQKTSKPVLVQILRSPLGGIGKHVRDIAEYFSADSSVEVLIFTNLSDANFTPQLPSNVIIYNLDIAEDPKPADLKNLIFMFNILRNKSVKVLHGHGAKGGFYSRLLGLFLRSKCIYTPHGGSLHRSHGRLKNCIYDAIEKLLIPLTNIFLFESKYSKELFVKNVGSNSRMAVNPNGIDVKTEVMPKKFSPGTMLNLKSFGLLRHLKGHDILIEACALLQKNQVPFHYTVFGKGEEKSNLEKLIQEKGLSDQVEIKPYTENIEAEMLTADIVVQPSRYESFGYVPIEAMALKVPVTSSFVGGLKEIMTEDIGYISYNNSPESYFDILKALYEGKTDPMLKAAKAYVTVQHDFSKTAMLRKIKTLYFS
ncbi:MAG: glycosyltransferase family 4 protein [Bdellovibrionota bacterium]